MSRLIWTYSVCHLVFFNIIQFILNFFRNFADVILSSAFLGLYKLKLNILALLLVAPTHRLCLSCILEMSLVVRKPVFGISDQV